MEETSTNRSEQGRKGSEQGHTLSPLMFIGIFSGLLLIAFIIICVYCIYVRCTQLQLDVVITTVIYQPPSHASDTTTDEQTECIICLATYESGDRLKVLPCNHRFHGDCLEKWLTDHATCPLCRYNLPNQHNHP
ncbi:E3 ubiquitin-protein ligase RING1-like [Senna tora]|uniref:E3 ubiquitin-protein ligase RING1-like n=1 Tax=Senna tora TaxID=362788 RepID=A0A834WGF5_9FABA|nr:E3 ubiquitin-protein ligase RING1-like [Senna tora]